MAQEGPAYGAEASAAHSSGLVNVVFMGMGEPLHNLAAVVEAIDIMTHPLGLHLSYSKVRCGMQIRACCLLIVWESAVSGLLRMLWCLTFVTRR
jgi:hypothetical protein